MGGGILQPSHSRAWSIVRQQHGVVARRQLLELGLTHKAIDHRIAIGRLHRLWRGVYAVGRPRVTQHGHWMAAVLACGPGAVLSHDDAAALWAIRSATNGVIDVSVPASVHRSRVGIVVHRRVKLNVTRHHGIPVTDPVCTLVDLAACIDQGELEAAVNEADKLDLVTPEDLRAGLEGMPRRPGVGALRRVLDRRTFTLTDSALERRFLPIVRRAGLPPPETQRIVNGYRVDFYWPDHGLVVETDGLRYHRTPAQQATDRLRDQVHTAAGLTSLRFTHAQVRYEPGHVRATLKALLGAAP
jgi:very-short-patch-repair endonuclease